jgi:pimeloyl-ACP methyl ester carboxylesterase
VEKLVEPIRSDTRASRWRVVAWLATATLFVLLPVMAGIALLYFDQHVMIYHPRPYRAHDLKRLPAQALELNYLTPAGRQYAFYLPPRRKGLLPARIWVAFCGNGSVALDWTFFVSEDKNSDDAFLLVDYPGYGKSDGYATIAGTRASADKALSVLADRLQTEESQLENRLNVIGHSLGAGVAFDFAVHHPVQRVIAIAPFTSLREEAATIVGATLSHLVTEDCDNRARLAELALRSTPPRVAIVHGTEDDVIPFRMGQRLASEFPKLVQFFPVQHADHLSVLEFGREQIFEWMNH